MVQDTSIWWHDFWFADLHPRPSPSFLLTNSKHFLKTGVFRFLNIHDSRNSNILLQSENCSHLFLNSKWHVLYICFLVTKPSLLRHRFTTHEGGVFKSKSINLKWKCTGSLDGIFIPPIIHTSIIIIWFFKNTLHTWHCILILEIKVEEEVISKKWALST